MGRYELQQEGDDEDRVLRVQDVESWDVDSEAGRQNLPLGMKASGESSVRHAGQSS